MRREDVALLEELNFNAWPALRVVHYDGWLWRSAGRGTRRPNSINPLVRGAIDLETKIATAERIYARWGRPTIFRLTPLAESELDTLLAGRGYVSEGETFVQVAEVAPLRPDADVRVAPRAEPRWLASASGLKVLSAEDEAAFAVQHRAVGVETGWAALDYGQETLAVGVVAIERGWAGLHGIQVAEHARRRGLGRRLSEALLAYAYDKGARRAWLQVEQTNAAAIAVYQGCGFATAYSYHYRVWPEQR